MEKAIEDFFNKLTLRKIIVGFIVVIMVLQVISMFPSIEFDGQRVRMFAPMRPRDIYPLDIRPWGHFEGRVLGTYVLRTEHGEITLRSLSRITAQWNTMSGINVANFREGRAEHNLVIGGVIMPPYITIGFTFRERDLQASIVLLRLFDQEIIVSDIPLGVNEVFVNHHRQTADIVMGVNSGPEYITLADITEIHIDPSRRFLGGLYIYKDDALWVLRNAHFSVPVKRPGDTEFTRFRSITFRPNWGEFIEGELFDEQ